MKKILFFGDSITDMGRIRNNNIVTQYGMGYVFLVSTKLKEKYPKQYQIINQGISGNTISDLIERYQEDVLNQKPDVLTILVGVNDVWHRIGNENSKGSKLPNFMKLYEEMIIDIKKQLPKVKIIILEPFFTHGLTTDYNNQYSSFQEVKKYAKSIQKLAKQYHIPFVKLQRKMEKGQAIYDTDCLYDGVHPNVVGASIIAKSWLKCFEKEIKK